MNSIICGRATEAIRLVRAGAPINQPDKQGTTPLYLAAVQGEAEIVRLLLEEGADPNLEAGGESEGTPLCAPAAWGRTGIVRMLLDHGADPNQVENKDEAGGMLTLRWALQNQHSETVALLLERGALDG